jgi:hypothetical protein
MTTAMEASRDRTHYLSHLLRLWCEGGEGDSGEAGGPVWRASLQDPYTGQRIGFGGPDEMFAFLRSRMAAQSGAQFEQDRG